VQEGRLIAISDVHVDIWQENDPDSFAEKSQALLDFLQWVRDGSGAEHFAIVGDLLDVPQMDHSPILPRYRDLLLLLWSIIQSGIKVYYVPGNHDAGLVGLDVAMTHPSFELVFPGVTVPCSDVKVRLEHGHLMDSWLWAFMQHKTSHVAAIPACEAMAHFASTRDYQLPAIPATAFIYETVYDALQWRPLEVGFTPGEKQLGIAVMSQHLEDTFSDVADNGELPDQHEAILAELDRLGLTVEQIKRGQGLPPEALKLFMPVGARYYSRLPWRRAAQCRMRSMLAEGEDIYGLIMGHTHHLDEFRWEQDGRPCVYANCGTWSGTMGSFVSVDHGEVHAHSRQWRDPLPEL
jgi:UDP-2,3-diacylglucosamine pyrophosphatase LpxH